MKGAAIGINLGTHSARAAFAAPGENAKLIPNRWGKTAMPSVPEWQNSEKYIPQDRLVSLIMTLREDAEVHLNDFVSSCVLAVPVTLSTEQKGSVVRAAKAAGIVKVNIIPEPVAAMLALGRGGRSLVLDFGARTTLSVVEVRNGEGYVLESVKAELPGGSDFDVALAAWLRERLRLTLGEEDPRQLMLLHEAEQIKIALSDMKSVHWTPPAQEGKSPLSPEDWPSPKLTIYREELECLIRFSLRRIIHTACRLWTQYAPVHLISTGGSSCIPLLKDILQQEGPRPKHQIHGTEDVVVRGAAILANKGISLREGQDNLTDEGKNWVRQIQDLEMSLFDIEALLTYSQQDRLHLLFQQAESAPSDPELLRLTKGLVHDLRQAVE